MTFAIGLVILALFVLVSLVPGEDPRHSFDPRDDMRFWIRYGMR